MSQNNSETPPETLQLTEDQSLKFSITVPEDYILLKNLAQADVEFVVRKDQTYDGSWRKRGGVGAAMMLLRKIDRLENFLKNHNKQYDIFDLVLSASDPEDILDDVKDLRCYLLLVESYLRQQMKEESSTGNFKKARRVAASQNLAASYGSQKAIKPEYTKGDDPLRGYGGNYGYDYE